MIGKSFSDSSSFLLCHIEGAEIENIWDSDFNIVLYSTKIKSVRLHLCCSHLTYSVHVYLILKSKGGCVRPLYFGHTNSLHWPKWNKYRVNIWVTGKQLSSYGEERTTINRYSRWEVILTQSSPLLYYPGGLRLPFQLDSFIIRIYRWFFGLHSSCVTP